MKEYKLTLTPKNPVAAVRLPRRILRDLALRAAENGRSIESEMAVRLARTLEHDLKMIAEDNEIAFLAFQKQENKWN